VRGFPPPIRITLPAIALAIGSVLLWFSVYRETSDSDRDALRRATDHARLLGTQVSGEVEAAGRRDDQPDALGAVHRLVADRDLEIAVLLDADDRVIASTQAALEGQRVAATRVGSMREHFRGVKERMTGMAVVSAGGGSVVSIDPLYLQALPGEIVSSRVGLLVAEHDITLPMRRARATAYRRTAYEAAALVVFCGLVWMALHTLVTRRVARLVDGTRRFASGALDTPMSLSGGDELRDLGDAFDEMARRVKEGLT
jgi:HAMP domain-containing protein